MTKTFRVSPGKLALKRNESEYEAGADKAGMPVLIRKPKIDLEQDVAVPKNEELQEISVLATKQLVAQTKVADLENLLALEKEGLRKIQEEELPESLLALGLKSFILSDGSKLDVKTFYRGNINKDNTEKAHLWLRDNNHADLIKNDVICSFGKGEDHGALQLMDKLSEMKVDYQNKKHVHASTLKAFVKEQVEAGKEIPLDLLGVHIGQRSEIRRQK